MPARRGHLAPLVGLGWDVGLPLVGYYALHLLGASDWTALLAGALAAGLRLVWVAVAHRRMTWFGALMLAVFGIGLLLALVGGDPRFVLVEGLVHHRRGRRRLPAEPARAAPADLLGLPVVAAHRGRRAGRDVGHRARRAAHLPGRRGRLGRRPDRRGRGAGADDLRAAGRRRRRRLHRAPDRGLHRCSGCGTPSTSSGPAAVSSRPAVSRPPRAARATTAPSRPRPRTGARRTPPPAARRAGRRVPGLRVERGHRRAQPLELGLAVLRDPGEQQPRVGRLEALDQEHPQDGLVAHASRRRRVEQPAPQLGAPRVGEAVGLRVRGPPSTRRRPGRRRPSSPAPGRCWCARPARRSARGRPRTAGSGRTRWPGPRRAARAGRGAGT